jgi:hypothetical protein
MKSMARFALGTLALAIVVVSGIACDRSGSGAGGGSQARPGKPGHLTGKLSDAQGKPLLNVTVSIFGFSDNGEPVTRETKVAGPAGEYDLELPSGKYNTPTARIAVDYNGRHYELPLAAADGTKEWLDQKESRTGMVRDFVWNVAGPVPGGDPLSPSGYWGGTIEFDKAGDLGDIAKIEITLRPEGPLIDRSEGKPVVFTRVWPWKKREDHYLLDVPLGRYTATAKILIGTRPKPLKLVSYTVDPANVDQAPPKMSTSVPIEFECKEVKPGEFKLMIPNLLAFPPG